MKKGRLIAGSIFGALSLVCFAAATLIIFSGLHDVEVSGDAAAGLALIAVFYLAFIVYGGQLISGIISLILTGGCFRSENKTVKTLATVAFFVVLAALIASAAVIAYLYLRG